MAVADSQARKVALDPSQSFIVQAPAGSGKTELLTQRYLALLTTVRQPEEILALTFTRKAASEMRHRIIAAMQRGLDTTAPDSEHQQQTWRLAQQVIVADERYQWHLLNNPSRLKIQTIDSLCASITRAMPVIAQFGSQPEIEQDATEHYARAAENLLSYLDDDTLGKPLQHLLHHCDNQLPYVKQLLVDLLQTREQWLSYLVQCPLHELREQLETSLYNVVAHSLQHYQDLLPELKPVLPYIAFVKNHLGFDHPLQAIDDLMLPATTAEHVSAWQAITAWLLTQDGTMRKMVTVKQGFPAPSGSKDKGEKEYFKTMKQQFLLLLEELSEFDELLHALQHIQLLPHPAYSLSQWQVLEALVTLLPLLVAELNLSFKQAAKIDFTGVAQAAQLALGTPEQPTDLALSLDYRIQHILVDEFQDTSINQIRLLQLLTAGWQQGDGRTLFFVGDPMQSIYRFRQAEVGLFLRVQQQGLGEVKLKLIRLQCNFRSTATIIGWINQHFQHILPFADDIDKGAIHYSSSVAVHAASPQSCVKWHTLTQGSDEDRYLVNEIKKIRARSPQSSIAVLVRARRHAYQIIQAMQQQNIPYQAVDIEYLADTAVINDLMVLTKALLHLSDRVAWLSVLRSPMIGLELHDLALITAGSSNDIIFKELSSLVLVQLSKQGQRAISRALPILQQAIEQRQRWPLRHCVESCWIALGGSASCSAKALSNAEQFFELLQTQQHDFCIHRFNQQLKFLYAKVQTTHDNPVQIMTVHKSKGLEFDCVFLPGLQRRVPIHSRALLDWLEMATEKGPQLIMAPIKAVESDNEAISDFIRYEQNIKDDYELARVLYVAATRAKQQLHWVTSINRNDEGVIKPASHGSLLATMWPAIEKTLAAASLIEYSPHSLLDEDDAMVLKRLPSDWQLPDNIQWQSSQANKTLQEQNIFEWHSPLATSTGTVVHRCLQALVEDPQLTFNRQQIAALLLLHQCPAAALTTAIQNVEQALRLVTEDKRGQWILQAHEDSQAEYAVAGRVGDSVIDGIIDRTFIDADGIRWIIDYKLSQPKDEELQQFIHSQAQQYALQLERYATLMQLRENRTIKLGLYFPLIPAWHEWEFNHAS